MINRGKIQLLLACIVSWESHLPTIHSVRHSSRQRACRNWSSDWATQSIPLTASHFTMVNSMSKNCSRRAECLWQETARADLSLYASMSRLTGRYAQLAMQWKSSITEAIAAMAVKSSWEIQRNIHPSRDANYVTRIAASSARKPSSAHVALTCAFEVVSSSASISMAWAGRSRSDSCSMAKMERSQILRPL